MMGERGERGAGSSALPAPSFARVRFQWWLVMRMLAHHMHACMHACVHAQATALAGRGPSRPRTKKQRKTHDMDGMALAVRRKVCTEACRCKVHARSAQHAPHALHEASLRGPQDLFVHAYADGGRRMRACVPLPVCVCARARVCVSMSG